MVFNPYGEQAAKAAVAVEETAVTAPAKAATPAPAKPVDYTAIIDRLRETHHNLAAATKEWERLEHQLVAAATWVREAEEKYHRALDALKAAL
jgi:regulator of sirC expression with transglutaminase-like and TPR domain